MAEMSEVEIPKAGKATVVFTRADAAVARDRHLGITDAGSAVESGRSIMGGLDFSLVGRRISSWTTRGASSVLQQGLFAGAHFVTNVLLARWLAPSAYGA